MEPSEIAIIISIIALVVSGISAIYSRRRTIVAEQQYKDMIQRRKIRIDLEVLRYDERSESHAKEPWQYAFGYPKYVVLQCGIYNQSNMPKLLEDIVVHFVLRHTSDLIYGCLLIWGKWDALWGRNADTHFVSVVDRAPYNKAFAGKVHVRLLDANTGSLVDLAQPVRIAAGDKLLLEVRMKTTDDWRQELRRGGEVVRHLRLQFGFADGIEEFRVGIQDRLGTRSRAHPSISEEAAMDRFWQAPPPNTRCTRRPNAALD